MGNSARKYRSRPTCKDTKSSADVGLQQAHGAICDCTCKAPETLHAADDGILLQSVTESSSDTCQVAAVSVQPSEGDDIRLESPTQECQAPHVADDGIPPWSPLPTRASYCYAWDIDPVSGTPLKPTTVDHPKPPAVDPPNPPPVSPPKDPPAEKMVRLCLRTEVAHLPRRLLQNVPFLEALTSSRWAQNKDRYELPSVPEFHDMGAVMDLIEFSNQTRPEDFSVPQDHGRAFSLVRLADIMGVDGFLTLMVTKLDVPASRINNSNSIRSVRRLFRDRYQASQASAKKFEGLCRKCRQPLAACPPERSSITTTLCCKQQVHSTCRDKSCAICTQSFTIFSCIVCRHPITYLEYYPVEAYLHAKSFQLPCCGADCHAKCRAGLSAGRCSCCGIPLVQGGESIDHKETAGLDYLYMRRERRFNDDRRKKRLVNYEHPGGQIDWSQRN